MRQGGGVKCQRIFIICLLSFSVLAPILFFPDKLASLTDSFARKEFLDDVSGFAHAQDSERLWAVQEDGEDVKEPLRIVYKDDDFNSVNSRISNIKFLEDKNTKDVRVDDDLSERNGLKFGNDRARDSGSRNQTNTTESLVPGREKGQRQPIRQSHMKKPSDETLRVLKDQLVMAKAYLNFAPPNSNSHLVKELRLRMKEVERAVGEATKDSDLHRSALQRMRSMESTLAKAGRVYSNCSPLASKLQAMTANTEEQLRAQRHQADYLIQLAARTFSKGFHCLSMRLTADYFALQPEEREFSNRQKLKEADLYHYALFSDNVLACTVVVNSTVSSSKEPEKIVFHVVTDALNLPAIAMWFLTNPPGKATIEVLSIDDFKPSSANHSPILKQGYSQDPRFKSSLNYLRFYLPELFPQLDKIVFLDHDVVVQRDLRGLWALDMRGKVVGAVEICGDDYGLSQRMDVLLNFSDPLVSKKFDAKVCTWSFGMNIFDLQEWRRHALTDVYHKWLLLGRRRQLWKDGSMPLGLVTFYNHTLALDQRWHLRGLGMQDSALGNREIERAAVIHYDGVMKPWLEIGIARYKGYWSKFLPYDHPFLQRCNIHP